MSSKNKLTITDVDRGLNVQEIMNRLAEISKPARKGRQGRHIDFSNLVSDGYSLESIAEDLGNVVTFSLQAEAEKMNELRRDLLFEEREEMKEQIIDSLNFRPTAEVASSWYGRQLTAQHKYLGTGLMSATSVNRWKQSYAKLAGSKGFNVISRVVHDDPHAATSLLMAAMSLLKEKFGTAGLRADWALKYILEMVNSLSDLPDDDGDSWFNQSGDVPLDLMAVALSIGPLIEKLKLQYEPYADRKEYVLEESLTESDEVDIVNLRGFTSRSFSRMTTSELLYDEEYSMMRIGTRQALQRVPMDRVLVPKKGANVKMLIDASGSMFDRYHDKTLDLRYTLWEFAVASAIALLDRGVLHGSNVVELIMFDQQPHPLGRMSPKKAIQALLTGPNCSGGGTSIRTVLKYADAIVSEELNNEIILITDGEDAVNDGDKPSQYLTTYFCGRGGNTKLEEISDKHHMVSQSS